MSNLSNVFKCLNDKLIDFLCIDNIAKVLIMQFFLQDPSDNQCKLPNAPSTNNQNNLDIFNEIDIKHEIFEDQKINESVSIFF